MMDEPLIFGYYLDGVAGRKPGSARESRRRLGQPPIGSGGPSL